MHFSGSLMKTIWNVRISSNICSCVEGAGRGGADAGAHVAERLVSILMMDHNYPGNILSSAPPLCSGHQTSKCPVQFVVCILVILDFLSCVIIFGIFISPLLVQSVSKCGGEPLVYVVQGGHGPRLIQTPPEGIILNKYTAEMSLYLGPTLKHLFLLPTLQGAELFKS